MESGQCSICHRAPAKFACSCTFPPISICATCTIVHLESPGTHIPVPIQKKGSGQSGPVQGANEVCDECRAKTAVKFCLCSVPFKKFCEGCDITHYQKAPRMAHFQHPMTAYQLVASGKVPLETFRRKQLFINDFQLRIGQELVRFDTFMKEVGDEFDQFLRQIAAKREAVLSDLQGKRVQLATYLSEVQQAIEIKRYAETTEVVTPLDDYIVSGYLSASPYEVKLFTGQLKLQEVEQILESAVSVEMLSGLFEQEIGLDIPVLKGNSLRLFNRKTLQMTQLQLSQTTRIDQATAYCYIGPTTLLAVGGSTHNEVYEVNVKSGKVDKVPNMANNRSYTGIINYKECVYAMGGYNGSGCLNTGEKYGLASKSWTALRNSLQAPKTGCSVCEHSNRLYISGISPGSSVECFNPIEETFRLIRSDSNPYLSILCCVGDELYLIRQTQIEVARLTNEPVTFTVKATITQTGTGHYWLCCPLKVTGGELISVLNSCGQPYGLFSLKAIQGQFTQVANFTY